MSRSRPELSHKEIQELLGAFALDAVDAETTVVVEQHLESCVKCAIEVAEYHEVAGLIANSGGEPPAGVWAGIASQLDESTPPSWERLAERLHSEDVVATQNPDILDQEVEGAAHSSRPDSDGRSTTPIRSERRSRAPVVRIAIIVSAVAAVVAIVLGIQVDHLDHQVNALKSPSLLTQAEQAFLNSPSTKRVHLTAPPGSDSSLDEGPVTVVLAKSGTGFVEAQGLSALPKNETYQLWGIIGSRTISLGLLGSDPAAVPFSAAGNATFEAFAITVEHSGGVVQSSHQPVVAGEV